MTVTNILRKLLCLTWCPSFRRHEMDHGCDTLFTLERILTNLNVFSLSSHKWHDETVTGWFLYISLDSYKIWMHLQIVYQWCTIRLKEQIWQLLKYTIFMHWQNNRCAKGSCTTTKQKDNSENESFFFLWVLALIQFRFKSFTLDACCCSFFFKCTWTAGSDSLPPSAILAWIALCKFWKTQGHQTGNILDLRIRLFKSFIANLGTCTGRQSHDILL